MRKLLLLSIGLALVLVLVINVQRALVLAMTSRPFLGSWAQDSTIFPGGPPSHIQFERGGTLWISRFGEPRRQAHWEDGARGAEIIVSGYDPARLNVSESYHWTISRGSLMIFPMTSPSSRVPVFRPFPGVLGLHYVRAVGTEWPAPKSFVGRWMSTIGRAPLRFRNRQFWGPSGPRMLLDMQPDGKLRLYTEGQPRRQGIWTADKAARTFSVVIQPAGKTGGGESWTGRVNDDLDTSISFNSRWPVTASPGQFAFQNRMGTFSTFRRMVGAPADRRPFVGVWRTRPHFSARQLQFALLPDGTFRITEPDGSSRRGTWRDDSVWPRLTLTGMDAKHPDRATEWYWWYEKRDWNSAYDNSPRAYPSGVVEVLELFDARANVTEPSEGTAVYMERLQPPSTELPQVRGSAAIATRLARYQLPLAPPPLLLPPP